MREMYIYKGNLPLKVSPSLYPQEDDNRKTLINGEDTNCRADLKLLYFSFPGRLVPGPPVTPPHTHTPFSCPPEDGI